MRKLILLLCFLASLNSCEFVDKIRNGTAASKDTVNASSEKKKFNGTRESRHDNGKLSSSVEYVEGERHGMAREYFEDGKLKLEMQYVHGKKQGRAVTYDEKGKIFRESFYVDDDLDGLRKIYSKGKIRAEIPYKKGMPGKGLVEYLVDGKLKTKYPALTVTPIDNRTETGFYHLLIEFSEVDHRDEFYLGDLLDGKYVHEGLEPINNERGHGKISIYVPSGSFIMREMRIVGVHYTVNGNPWVTTRDYNLSIE
jgi:antitoxin component YwqK of YwqJK toxin-antitoxin module